MKRALMAWLTGVALAASAASADAQVDGFLSANALSQWPTASALTQDAVWPLRQEMAALSAKYALETALAFEIRGGVVRAIGPRWAAGFGLGVSRVHDAPQAAIDVAFPHPILFNRPARATGGTDGLSRTEIATHLEGVLRTTAGRVTLSFFGGPSRFRLTQRLVSNVSVEEALVLSPALPYTVRLTSVETKEEQLAVWGYTVGTDASVFLTRHVGVGGMVRYSRASGNLPNAAQNSIDGNESATVEHVLGGVSVGGGARVRF